MKNELKRGIVKFLDDHKWELIFAVIFALLFGVLYEVLKNSIWVPVLVICLLVYNIIKKYKITHLIESLKYEQNRHERLSIVKKLNNLINHTVKCFILGKVWSVAIADLDWCMSNFNEPGNADVRHWIATAMGEIGGTNAIKALCRAMGEEDIFARLGVTDALVRQGTRAIKEVVKFSSSDAPLVRLSVATVLVSIGKDNRRAESVLAQLKNDPDKCVRDVANDYWIEKERRKLKGGGGGRRCNRITTFFRIK